MKLFYSPTSPFVRKVSVTAEVTGLASRIERVSSAPHPIDRDRSIIAANPLGKAPTLVTDDGQVLFDSRVIVEYLDANSVADRVIPAAGAERWRVLALQALGDGILDAALLLRYEGLVRTPAQQSVTWKAGQLDKIADALDAIEHRAAVLGDELNIGNITVGAALGFLDFRLPDLDWRASRPASAVWFERFDAIPAVAATRPAAPVPAQ